MSLGSQVENDLAKVANPSSRIAAALVKAQSKMGNALKDSLNPFFKSKYADLNSIREAVMPILSEHGIAVLQPTVHLNEKNFVQTVLLHESGETLSCFTEIVVSKQNDPQAQGSGISYARRYGLQSFLNVGAEDDDGERAMDRTATPKKTADVTVAAVTAKAQAAIARKKITKEKFVNGLGMPNEASVMAALTSVSKADLVSINKELEDLLK